jgi:molecular chaperone DnaK
VPQIEVTFDIDANGIVHVSAKDLGTGKEQSIRITASSGLSEEEIKQRIKDAEAHAEEDKKKRELIEARNQLDSLIYATERSMSDLGDKLSAEEKGNVNVALEDAKKALESKEPEAIKTAMETLTKASHKLSEEVYKKAAAGAAAAGGSANPGSEQATDSGTDKDADVVDADFEEVRDSSSK